MNTGECTSTVMTYFKLSFQYDLPVLPIPTSPADLKELLNILIPYFILGAIFN